ncbi:MAG: hypothetical protein U0T84_01940 [Chitinophagales bacterium]
MKKIVIATALFCSAASFAQQPIVNTCTSFAISKPLWQLAKEYPYHPSRHFEKEGEHRRLRPVVMRSVEATDPLWFPQDTAVYDSLPILAQWNGMNTNASPPDPSGAAGPNHYVQVVNSSYQIWNKTGTSLLGPFNLSNLWSGSHDDGDPVVLYDRFADRWVISEFDLGPSQNGPYKQLFAVSKTSDPTGQYYLYQFSLTDFKDYPKFSIWQDGYYMGTNTDPAGLLVFERDKMLVGDNTARNIELTAPGITNNGFFCPMPADADGNLPPAGTPMYFFHYEDDNWTSADVIKVIKVTTDWTNTANTTATLDATLATASFDTDFGTTWNNIRQKGTNQRVDALIGTFMFRAPFRVWSGYNSVLLNHTVDIDQQNHAGIRWYELRQTSGTWGIYQQGTYAPDTNSRWCGSMAMDDNGNIAMAYSISSRSLYPSLRYTARYATDPLGKMTFKEKTGIDGTGSINGDNRFGDYAHMSLDPDGETFWFTGEYVSTGGTQRSRIFSFKIPKKGNVGITASDEPVSLKVLTLHAGLWQVVANGLTDDVKVQLDLINNLGQTVWQQTDAAHAGQLSTAVETTGLPHGIYYLRLAVNHQQRVAKIVW